MKKILLWIFLFGPMLHRYLDEECNLYFRGGGFNVIFFVVLNPALWALAYIFNW